MKFNATWNPFRPENFETWQQWAIRLAAGIGRLLDALSQLLNGQITFGDGRDYDNIKGQWIVVTSHAVAGTETQVPHALGVIPPGFILMIPPTDSRVDRGPTPWTAQHIYLRCYTASQTFTIFVLAPPATE